MKALQDLVGKTVLANVVEQETFEPALLSGAEEGQVTFSWPSGEAVHWNLAYVWRIWSGPIEWTEPGGKWNARKIQVAAQVDLIHMAPPPDEGEGGRSGMSFGVGAIIPMP